METDYVVVGAGTAGCVVARRLAEYREAEVLVLEAGEWPVAAAHDDPHRYDALIGTPAVRLYETEPQPGAGGRRLPALRGEAVGGSSAVNAMFHCWPSRSDLDGWGLPGWRFDDLAPRLAAAETRPGASSGGGHGPIVVAPLADPPLITQRFVGAAGRLGYGLRANPEDGGETGVGVPTLAFHAGQRQDAGRRYLAPALAGGRVRLQTRARVTRILVEGGRAVGVEARLPGTDWTVRARAGVILCAGSLEDPVILLRSGIGSADLLRRLGLPVVHDLPAVGLGLKEHYLVFGLVHATPAPVARGAGHRAAGLLYGSTEGGRRDFTITLLADAAVWPPLRGAPHGFQLAFSLTRPLSRGRVTLREADLEPSIDPAFFADSRDLPRLRRVFATARELLATPELAELGGVELNPGADASEADIERFLLNAGVGFQHSTGTCRMGVDAQAVVDTRCRVRGVPGLHVVDASIFPDIPSVPTNATVLGVAEQGAALIAADAA